VLIPEITAKRFGNAKTNLRRRIASIEKRLTSLRPSGDFDSPDIPPAAKPGRRGEWTAQTLICFCVAGHTPTGMSAATVINHRRFSEEPKSG
jgi:hypothetical protein